jgi:V/A-type H+-transporting ATPase subunit I
MEIGIVPKTFYLLGVPLPFNRIEAVPVVMVLAILTGFIQVALGLALGIANAVRTKSRSHLFERVGLLTVLFAAPIMIVAVSGVLEQRYGPIAMAVGSLALGVGAFFAVKGGKAVGAVEMIGQFGNVFSYLRIMAVGLAGAIFAEAANEITAGLIPMTGWVFAIVVGIVLHSLNIAISAFSPNIHALRLNFLEFFGKFYESGTRRYEPFHRARGEEHQ